MGHLGICNVNLGEDLWRMAIERGAVIAVDFFVFNDHFSTAFYDTDQPLANGLYHEVGSYSCDLKIFMPQDRMATQDYVSNSHESDSGTHVMNKQFAEFRAQLEKNVAHRHDDAGSFSM